jgi:regulatory protein
MATRRNPPKRYAGEELMNFALRSLSLRSSTTAELQRKLTARAENPAEVPAILARLTESRLLNDDRFAESFTHARRDLRLFGPQRVRRELAQRQIANPLAEATIREAYAEVDETSLALAHLERKIRVSDPAAHFQDPKNLQSAFRKLVYAGFSPTAAGKALKQFSAHAADLEDFDPTVEDS